MAAITGLGEFSITFWTSNRLAPFGALPNSLMSAPAMNVLPSQTSTIALVLASAIAFLKPSANPSRTGAERAFTGGELSVRTAISPSFARSVTSLMADILFRPCVAVGRKSAWAPERVQTGRADGVVAAASGSAEREVGDVRIGFPLPAERRHLPVARYEAHFVAERPESLRDRADEVAVIAAGKVGAPHRAREEHVADQRQPDALVEEHDVAGRMAGTMSHPEFHL